MVNRRQAPSEARKLHSLHFAELAAALDCRKDAVGVGVGDEGAPTSLGSTCSTGSTGSACGAGSTSSKSVFGTGTTLAARAAKAATGSTAHAGRAGSAGNTRSPTPVFWTGKTPADTTHIVVGLSAAQVAAAARGVEGRQQLGPVHAGGGGGV